MIQRHSFQQQLDEARDEQSKKMQARDDVAQLSTPTIPPMYVSATTTGLLVKL